MNETLTVLGQCRLFQGLPPETLERDILPQGKPQAFEKQSVLITPGDRVDWFGVVLQGRAQISQIFSDGTSSLMDALGPGCPLGTDLIFTRSRRSPYYAIAAGGLHVLQFPTSLLLKPGTLPGSVGRQPPQTLPAGDLISAGSSGAGAGLSHHAGGAAGDRGLSDSLLPGRAGGLSLR